MMEKNKKSLGAFLGEYGAFIAFQSPDWQRISRVSPVPFYSKY